MDPILQETFSIAFLLRNFISEGLIDNKSIFVQAMAWHQQGNKSLSMLMMTKFTEAGIQPQAQEFNFLIGLVAL